MEDKDAINEAHQEPQKEHRTRVDAETRGSMHPPRTVEEQVEQLDEGTEEHRRRDPLGGARRQQEEYPDNGSDQQEPLDSGDETRQRFGDTVKSGTRTQEGDPSDD